METNEGTPGTETPAPAAPLSGAGLHAAAAAKKDEIRSRVRAAASPIAAEATPAPVVAPVVAAKPADKPATPAAAPAPVADDPRVADLTAKLTAALAERDELKGKVPAEDKYAALVERLKGDPSVVLDEFGEHGVTLEAISERVIKKQDNPAHAELTGLAKELHDLKAERAAEKAALVEKDKATQTATAEAEGRALVKTMVEGDKARWPIVTGHADNVAEAIPAAIEAARIVAKKLGRIPNAEEAEKILGDCFDDIEKVLEAKGSRYRKPDITPAAAAPPRRTIPTAPPAGGQREVPPAKKVTKADIIARVRREAAKQPQS